MQRCETILTDRCNFKCPYCRDLRPDCKDAGYPDGRDLEFWYKAERMFREWTIPSDQPARARIGQSRTMKMPTKRLNFNRYTPAAVYLKVHTYVGSATVFWDKHWQDWQGTLFCGNDREGVPVKFTMTQADADAENKDDGPYGMDGTIGVYKEGEDRTRLLSREAMLAAVEPYFNRRAL